MLTLFTLCVKGQTIDITLPPIPSQENSWQFLQQASVMNGRNSPIQAYIEITVSQNDELILTGQTSQLLLPTGLRSFAGLGINISSFVPSYIKPSYDGTFATLQQSPGELEICLSLHTHYEIARRVSECQSLMVTNFEELHLVTPFNNSKVKPGKFTYTWTHNGNIAASTYTLKIVEVEEAEINEISDQEFYSRTPYFEEGGIPFPLLEDRVINQSYSCDKHYMWSVAKEGSEGRPAIWASEIWMFQPNCEKNTANYIVPSESRLEHYQSLAEDGVLRIQYKTRYHNDTLAIGVDNKHQQLSESNESRVALHTGINYIALPITHLMTSGGKVLPLVLRNRAGEVHFIKLDVSDISATVQQKAATRE